MTIEIREEKLWQRDGAGLAGPMLEFDPTDSLMHGSETARLGAFTEGGRGFLVVELQSTGATVLDCSSYSASSM